MALSGLLVVAVGIVLFGVFSKRLEGTIITLPIVFVAFGWAVGNGGFGIAGIDPGHGIIHVIAELTLILVLFADAARIDLKLLIKDHGLPLRMRILGFPLTMILGAVTAMGVFPGITLAEAALLAAILAPTDAALGQAVLTSPLVPARIRQAINVESGLNDGMALPVVIVCAIWAGGAAMGEAGGGHGSDNIAVFAVLQVTLGPLAGIAVGFLGGRIIDWASAREWMSEAFQGISILAVALIAFGSAEMIGGNGFIAAFLAGLCFGATIRHRCAFLFEFMETEGQLLTLIAFLIFGAAMFPAGLAALDWQIVLYAVLSLTLVRMIPVVLSLTGTGISMTTKGFLAWFGPRGLASILFALLILEKYPIAGADAIVACVVVTVGLSTLLHGITAAPMARAYGKMVARKGECEETKAVTEMPLRHGQMAADNAVKETTP
jgi:NhaP-type Na+/H+ or K+/H+ antiporter